MNTWVLLMLISGGAVSLAIGVSFTVPTEINEVVLVWSSWLRPPYLHILINAIIIAIAASSRFPQTKSQHLISVATPPPAYSAQPEIVEVPQVAAAVYDDEDGFVELKPIILVNGSEVDIEEEEEEDAFLPPERNIPEKATEARFETLDSIWKKIMEGASRASHEEVLHVGSPQPSKSFKERNGDEYSPSYGLRKEASPSPDELNHRVETFIKRVNHEMRLQRQESLYGRN